MGLVANYHFVIIWRAALNRYARWIGFPSGLSQENKKGRHLSYVERYRPALGLFNCMDDFYTWMNAIQLLTQMISALPKIVMLVLVPFLN